jgi:hypothetical protein
MNTATYGKLTAGLIAAWFVFALGASALHIFQTDPALPPLALGLAALIPVAAFLIWFAMSSGFREFALSLDPRTLTFIQAWRIIGFTFLPLFAAGLLPGVLALPAGWGDIAIGVTAPLAALKFATFGRRRAFVLWQILGILDLVTAMTLGPAARLISPHEVAPSLMMELPMSLIPTFGVPLFIMLHVICIAQARRWKERQDLRVGEQLLHSA